MIGLICKHILMFIAKGCAHLSAIYITSAEVPMILPKGSKSGENVISFERKIIL